MLSSYFQAGRPSKARIQGHGCCLGPAVGRSGRDNLITVAEFHTFLENDEETCIHWGGEPGRANQGCGWPAVLFEGVNKNE